MARRSALKLPGDGVGYEEWRVATSTDVFNKYTGTCTCTCKFIGIKSPTNYSRLVSADSGVLSCTRQYYCMHSTVTRAENPNSAVDLE
eukprot:COSAG05_NODE_11519_length_509_cov_1.485366_1_plen_87_part_10